MLKIVALILSITLASSQTTTTTVPVFATTPVASSTTAVTISTASSVYGTLVTFSSAGWVVSNDISASGAVSASTVSNTWIVVPLKMSGLTSVGLAVIGGSPYIPQATPAQTACTSTGVFTSSKSSLTGQTSTSATCPTDFASVFSATASSSTSSSGFANVKLIVNVPTQVTFTQPASTSTSTQISYTTPGSGTNTGIWTASSPTVAATDALQVLRSAASNPPLFGFYIQADAAAIICMQSTTQYAANPGCGMVTNKATSSAGKLSLVLAPLLLLSALAF